MIKYLSNEEIKLIEEVKEIYDMLAHDMVELKTQEFILDAQNDILKKAFQDFEIKKDSLIQSIISVHGEGIVDLNKGTIEIEE